MVHFVHYAIALASAVFFTVQACKAPPGVVAWLPALGLLASLAMLVVSILLMGAEKNRR